MGDGGRGKAIPTQGDQHGPPTSAGLPQDQAAAARPTESQGEPKGLE